MRVLARVLTLKKSADLRRPGRTIRTLDSSCSDTSAIRYRIPEQTARTWCRSLRANWLNAAMRCDAVRLRVRTFYDPEPSSDNSREKIETTEGESGIDESQPLRACESRRALPCPAIRLPWLLSAHEAANQHHRARRVSARPGSVPVVLVGARARPPIVSGVVR